MAPSKFSNCRREMIQFTTKCRIFLLLILLFLLRSSLASTEGVDCGTNKTIMSGSALEGNLKVVLNSLVENVNKTGYNISSYGENGDKVYGLAQCRGDLNASACRACVSNATKTVAESCVGISASILKWEEGCFLRYANQSFYSHFNYLDVVQCYGFVPDRGLNSSLAAVLSNASFSTLSENAESSNVSYGTLSKDGVYSLAQCWRDLSPDQCRLCLSSMYSDLEVCATVLGGSGVRNDNCMVQYAKDKFYGDGVPLLSNESGSARARAPSPAKLGKNHGAGKNHLYLPLMLELTIASVVAVALLWFVLIWKKKYKKRLLPGISKHLSELSTAISKSKLNYKFQTLNIATNNFSATNKIGQGGFGSIYKGVLPDGGEIAVKRLFSNREQSVIDFFNEVNLISGVQHKNLVKLLGCSVDSIDRLLVYEYLPNKSLDRFIFYENMRNILDWQRRFEIIMGIASGLTYLHQESDIRIIHRDIKASNILLDQHFKPKIADFGLVRYFAEDQTHLITRIAGTRGYMAPEYIVHGHLTEKVDVYAFGVLVIEIASGIKNNTSMNDNDTPSLLTMVWNHYLSSTLSNIIDPNIQQNCKDEVLRVVHIALLCTQASATLRPSMSQVIGFLTNKDLRIPTTTRPPFIDVTNSQLNTNNSATFGHSQSDINIDVSHRSETYITPISNIASSPATISLNTISTSSFGPR